MDDDELRRHYRLSKNIVRWFCDELRDDAALRWQRRARTVMTVEQQALCARRFYATGSYQGQVASNRHLAVHQTAANACVRAVAKAIVRRLGPRRITFPETAEERAATQEAFLRHGSLPGLVGCVDGTFVAIKGHSKYDPTLTRALYWCRKLYCALNVMVVSDADLRILAIEPRMPGSTHDSYVWWRSWVRQEWVAGHLVRHNEYLLALADDSSAWAASTWHTGWAIQSGPRLHESSREALHRTSEEQIAGTIVAACAVLHNVCLCSGESEPEPQSESDSSSDEDDDEEQSVDAAGERKNLQARLCGTVLVLLSNTTHLQRVRDRLRRIRRRRQHR
ncbi:hypothetical protein HPB47_004448 [Ixodes persulcatus]|uniref:Uncharacterized protein n=1 Tax=Ixodes persulcatus TaxID=34615 RepID=A0AC60PFQ1_IXOPE|nr:hypothetical protein HPB47_004448 [Ixodes persulcatus]